MAKIEIEGRMFDVDGDGFLSTPGLWNEKHWAIIKIIRKNWEEKGMAPMIRTICQETGIKLREIYELFPNGPARGACKIAGLPKPDGCV
jgi:tRNA 2-thiouridine synthesizing protein E